MGSTRITPSGGHPTHSPRLPRSPLGGIPPPAQALQNQTSGKVWASPWGGVGTRPPPPPLPRSAPLVRGAPLPETETAARSATNCAGRAEETGCLIFLHSRSHRWLLAARMRPWRVALTQTQSALQRVLPKARFWADNG